MRRKRASPGVYFSLEKVKEMLTKEFYGTIDLVKLGLFRNDYAISCCIKDKQLKAEKVNRNSLIIITRDSLLKYWESHRLKDFCSINQKISFNCTLEERRAISGVVASIREKSDQRFCLDDLFRNFCQLCIKPEEGYPLDQKGTNNVLFKVNT